MPATIVFPDMQVSARNEWLISIIFLWFFIVFVCVRSWILLISLSALLSVLISLNAGLAISYIMQGAAFNHQFFAHLDLSTLSVAWTAERTRLIMVVLYILIAPLIVYIGLKTKFRTKKSLAGKYFQQSILSIISLSIYFMYNTPLINLIQVNHYSKLSDLRIQKTIDTFSTNHSQTRQGNNKNIVLLYLEGLEQNYLDEKLFPDLLPQIQKLKQEAISFTNVVQYPGTGWTIAGLVSSQCGVPLLSNKGGNSVLKQVDNPFTEVDCLAEYLKGLAYNTVYIGGASLNFAGKGSFLTDNGFDTVLGVDELPSSDAHGWGLFDQYLFSHMEKLFDGLALQDNPFLLSALTLDTHHPTGTPSPDCSQFGAGDNAMLNSVHCTDQLVGDFVDHVRSSNVGANTIIVLVSDHLAMPTGVVERLSSKERRLLFMILDPAEKSPLEYVGQAGHFDIAPTILSSLGVEGAEFAFGHSLLQNREGKAVQNGLNMSDFNAFRIEKLVNRF